MWIEIVVGASGVALVSWLVRQEQMTRARLREALLRLAELKTTRHLQLVEEQSKQQALLDSMVEGVLLLDPQGRVEHMNPALVRLFGLSGEIRNKPVAEAVYRLGRLTASYIHFYLPSNPRAAAELLLP